MGGTVFTSMLVLPALFVLGLLIAWLLMRRHQEVLVGQIERLRNDRRRLAQKLLIARDRLLARRDMSRRLQSDNERLLQAQDRLESEHAELAVRFNNLQAGFPVQPQVSAGKPMLSVVGGLETTLADADRQLISAPSRSGSGARSTALALNESLDDDWLVDSEQNKTGLPYALDPEITTDLGPSSLIDEPFDSPNQPATSIEEVCTRFPSTLMQTGGLSNEIRNDALETLKEFEAQLLAENARDHPDEEAYDSQDLLIQLADRDAEISRLKEQIAPLLGLPLAISARESERDQIARRLAEREARIAKLEAQLTGQTGLSPGLSTVQASPGLIDALSRAEREINGNTDTEDSNKSIEPARSVEVSDHSITSSVTIVRQYVDVPDEVDNLKRIRGIGPVLERMLNRLGIYQYRQIASWSPSDIEYFDHALHEFRGRIERDNWIEGARIQHERKYHQFT